MEYSWLVGLRKAVYVAVMMLSVTVTAMAKTGHFNGPQDLTWPLLLSGLAVGCDWLRNYLKVAEPEGSKNISKAPVVALFVALAAILSGCAYSGTHFRETANKGTPDELITEYDGISVTPPLAKRESANLVWSYELKGGDSKISTGQEDKGIDTTAQAQAFEMLGTMIGKAIEAWVTAQTANGASLTDLLHDAVPIVEPLVKGK